MFEAVINYYLYKRVEVDAYLCQRKAEAERIRIENEQRFPSEDTRLKKEGAETAPCAARQTIRSEEKEMNPRRFLGCEICHYALLITRYAEEFNAKGR